MKSDITVSNINDELLMVNYHNDSNINKYNNIALIMN